MFEANQKVWCAMFEVGQKVICKVHGEGVVTDVGISMNESHPVFVQFIGGEWDCYTEDGKLCYLDDKPCLIVIEE